MSGSKNDPHDSMSTICEDISPLVIDLGFQNCKFGHNQQEAPRIFFSSICGEYVNYEENNSSNRQWNELKLEELYEKKRKRKLLFPLNLSNVYEHVKIKPLFYKAHGSDTLQFNSDVFETIMEYSIEGATPGKVFEYNDDVFHTPIKIGGMNLRFEEHPLLLSDFNKHNNSVRNEMAEILFEKYNVPALYFAKKAKLTSYSVGRTTSLVIDIGASCLNINPVYEGCVLQKNSYESNMGGNYLDSLIYEQLVKENINVNMLPDFCRSNINNVNEEILKSIHSSYFLEGIYDFIRYMKSSICKVRGCDDSAGVEKQEREKGKEKDKEKEKEKGRDKRRERGKEKGKEKGKAKGREKKNEKGKAKEEDKEKENENEHEKENEKENISNGINNLLNNINIKNNKISILANTIAGKGTDNGGVKSDAASDAGKERVFELPDGSLINVEKFEYDIAETLFKTVHFDNGEYKGLLTCIKNCILSNDVDIRKDLLQSVVLTGGSSLFPGLPERLYSILREEDAFCQTAKLKVINLSSSVENMYSSWLGGSILASLGTFQQMWISKKQYQERGSQYIDEKCY